MSRSQEAASLDIEGAGTRQEDIITRISLEIDAEYRWQLDIANQELKAVRCVSVRRTRLVTGNSHRFLLCYGYHDMIVEVKT